MLDKNHSFLLANSKIFVNKLPLEDMFNPKTNQFISQYFMTLEGNTKSLNKEHLKHICGFETIQELKDFLHQKIDSIKV